MRPAGYVGNGRSSRRANHVRNGTRKRLRHRGGRRTIRIIPTLSATAASILLLSQPHPDVLHLASAADVAAASLDEELRPTAAETALPVEDVESDGEEFEPDLGGVEHKTATGERCHWGTAGCHAESPAAAGSAAAGAKPKKGAEGGGGDHKAGAFVPKKAAAPLRDQKRNDSDAATAAVHRQKNASTFKFDKESHDGTVHLPPDGFVLSAHVVTDPSDGLSYFVDTNAEDAQNLLVPFLECGAVGSATEHFTVKSGSFRHFPSGSDPSAWSTAGGGTGTGDDDATTTTAASASAEHSHYGNPQLVVALHPLEITVSGNGGESRTFDAGDVILMGDTMGRGHKMRAARRGKHINAAHPEENDLSVMVLNLPHHHHHHYHHSHATLSNNPKAATRFGAEEHLSVLGLRRPARARSPPASTASSSSSARAAPFRRRGGRADPCKLEHDPAYSTLGVQSPSPPRGAPAAVPFPPVLSALGLSSPRRIILAAAGVAFSSFLTYFVYRVAPPVLGLLGVLGLAAGGTAVIDGVAGFVLEEWSAWEDLRKARLEEDGEYEAGTERHGEPDDIVGSKEDMSSVHRTGEEDEIL